MISLSQKRSWPERFKPPKALLLAWTRSQRNVETLSTRRIRLSPCYVRQNMAARLLPWKLVRVHKNINIKTWKDPTNTSNYCPIALTCVLCKVMERIVNVRLLDFFEQKGALSTLKCGGRAKQRTIDHLLSLEATVRKAQANSEHVVSIFFDMEKSIWFNMETRHPDGHTRSRNRRKNVQVHRKLSQSQIL